MAKPNYPYRFRRLANYIASQPEECFDQRFWFHNCATPGCIAGHCAAMLGWRAEHTHDLVSRFLGLNRDDILFSPHAPWQTRDAAVAELRRRADALEGNA